MHSEKGLSVSAVLGHNASKWLAHALNRQHVRGYHQRLFKMCGFGNWRKAFRYLLDHRVDDQRLRPYWEAVNADVKKGYDVIDTNVWPSYLVASINHYYPLKHIIYVTRNGMNWLHSVSRASSYRRKDLRLFGVNQYLKLYWELMGEPFKDWWEWSHWERLCLYWSTSYHMPNLLEKQGFKVHRYRMEDLVGGAEIYELYDLFGLDVRGSKVQQIQQTDVNSHIAKASVRDIWRGWSHEQRNDFRRICDEGQAYYDYQTL